MMGLALALALALAAQAKVPEGAGSVWLGCSPARQEALHPSVMLVAAPPDSPAPLWTGVWGGDGDTEILDLRAGAEEPDVVALGRVRRARRLLLGPGDVRQWRAALWDDRRPSALARALREAWGGGAQVVAVGAGALLLGETWLDVELDAHGREVTLARPGLVLCAGVTIDGEVRDGEARGVDLGPLLERLLARDTSLALWLSGPGGVRYEPAGARWIGSGRGALAFDARAARHTAGGVERVLVEWIGDGRAGLARDPLRLAPLRDLGQVELRSGIDPWNPRHWLVPPGEGRTRQGTGADGRLLLVGLPEEDGLAPAAWMSFEP